MESERGSCPHHTAKHLTCPDSVLQTIVELAYNQKTARNHVNPAWTRAIQTIILDLIIMLNSEGSEILEYF
jgi:hypothetical protein